MYLLYGPGAFQIASSVLGLEASELKLQPFNCGVSVNYSTLAFLAVSPAGFQSQVLWELLFLVQVSWVGEPKSSAQTPHSLGWTATVVIFLLPISCHSVVMGPD